MEGAPMCDERLLNDCPAKARLALERERLWKELSEERAENRNCVEWAKRLRRERDDAREALMVAHHCLTGLRGSPLVGEAVQTIEEALSNEPAREWPRGKFDAFTADELRLLKERVPEWGPAVDGALQAVA
jgi:hypothetical protein